jgi:hypothetical protein
MTSLINFNQNEIIIENATILDNKNVAYTIRRYTNNQQDDKTFQSNVDDILKKTKYIINDYDFLDENNDYKKLDMPKPLGIQPYHIKEIEIKKPEEKEPNLIKFFFDKFSKKSRKNSTPAQLADDESSFDTVKSRKNTIDD